MRQTFCLISLFLCGPSWSQEHHDVHAAGPVESEMVSEVLALDSAVVREKTTQGSLVEECDQNDGRVIVLPVQTKWVESQILKGASQLQNHSSTPVEAAPIPSTEHHHGH